MSCVRLLVFLLFCNLCAVLASSHKVGFEMVFGEMANQSRAVSRGQEGSRRDPSDAWHPRAADDSDQQALAASGMSDHKSRKFSKEPEESFNAEQEIDCEDLNAFFLVRLFAAHRSTVMLGGLCALPFDETDLLCCDLEDPSADVIVVIQVRAEEECLLAFTVPDGWRPPRPGPQLGFRKDEVDMSEFVMSLRLPLLMSLVRVLEIPSAHSPTQESVPGSPFRRHVFCVQVPTSRTRAAMQGMQIAAQEGLPAMSSGSWLFACETEGDMSSVFGLLKRAGCRMHDIDKEYAIFELVGVGSSSKVFVGEDRRTGEQVAIKVCMQEQMSKEIDLLREAAILRWARHPTVLQFRGIFETHDALTGRLAWAMVTEFVSGGELFERVRKHGRLEEGKGTYVVHQLFSALNFLHQRGIIHRDIKTENVIVANEKGHLVKLVDFGLATPEWDRDSMRVRCGSPGYIAPEVLRGEQYGCKVDCFAIGVLMFILLVGYAPFRGSNLDDILKRNMRCKVSNCAIARMSDSAKELLTKLLVPYPENRPTAKECMDMDWLANPAAFTGIEANVHTEKRALAQHRGRRAFSKQLDFSDIVFRQLRFCDSPTGNSKQALDNSAGLQQWSSMVTQTGGVAGTSPRVGPTISPVSPSTPNEQDPHDAFGIDQERISVGTASLLSLEREKAASQGGDGVGWESVKDSRQTLFDRLTYEGGRVERPTVERVTLERVTGMSAFRAQGDAALDGCLGDGRITLDQDQERWTLREGDAALDGVESGRTTLDQERWTFRQGNDSPQGSNVGVFRTTEPIWGEVQKNFSRRWRKSAEASSKSQNHSGCPSGQNSSSNMSHGFTDHGDTRASFPRPHTAQSTPYSSETCNVAFSERLSEGLRRVPSGDRFVHVDCTSTHSFDDLSEGAFEFRVQDDRLSEYFCSVISTKGTRDRDDEDLTGVTLAQDERGRLSETPRTNTDRQPAIPADFSEDSEDEVGGRISFAQFQVGKDGHFKESFQSFREVRTLDDGRGSRQSAALLIQGIERRSAAAGGGPAGREEEEERAGLLLA
eukprot:TRINITY_DN27543_c0_g1_i1.p1 TRINITY_DN27543_c0_g1~~TRINITY_DN27543_c0_g1_i1.p1  ORF type:complete len:1061 (+),score=152.96 TRINITY_DN27543_c0_g1_i1:44-3184(+)